MHELAFEGRSRRFLRSLECLQRGLSVSRLPSETVRYLCRGRLSHRSHSWPSPPLTVLSIQSTWSQINHYKDCNSIGKTKGMTSRTSSNALPSGYRTLYSTRVPSATPQKYI